MRLVTGQPSSERNATTVRAATFPTRPARETSARNVASLAPAGIDYPLHADVHDAAERPEDREKHPNTDSGARPFRATPRISSRCAGAIPQVSDPAKDGENALWVPVEKVIAVGWE